MKTKLIIILITFMSITIFAKSSSTKKTVKALIVVDVQNDFVKNGSLEVKDGEKIIPTVNKLISEFKIVVATQDWHPKSHKSFAVNHKGKKVFDVIDINGISQVLWPAHCVQNSNGAKFCSELNISKFSKIIKKGTDVDIDSYSGFYDNGHLKSTELSNYLKSKNVTEVYIVGLATDYCVKYTCIDSAKEGFKTFCYIDATKSVDPNSLQASIKEMQDAGVKIIYSTKSK